MPKPKARPLATADALFEYGAWYLSRYAVSARRLAFRLALRSADPSLVAGVLERLAPYVDDAREIESRVASAIDAGKPLADVRRKLAQKGFRKEDVEAVLAGKSDETGDFSRYEAAVRRRYATLVARRYGPAVVERTLRSEYPRFSDEIAGILAEGESRAHGPSLDAFLAERDRTDLSDPKAKKRLADKLLRRGFAYREVSAFLELPEE